MAISAKEIVIILLGLIGSIFLGLLIERMNIKLIEIKDYITIIILFIVIISAIIIVTYKKFSEINRELENQKFEQKRLDEKLKIYKRLSKIEKRVFENGNKS